MQIRKKWLNQLNYFFNKHFWESYLASFCWWISSSCENHCTLPYSCSICSKSFSQSAHLQNHLSLETSDKPLTWSECREWFEETCPRSHMWEISTAAPSAQGHTPCQVSWRDMYELTQVVQRHFPCQHTCNNIWEFTSMWNPVAALNLENHIPTVVSLFAQTFENVQDSQGWKSLHSASVL